MDQPTVPDDDRAGDEPVDEVNDRREPLRYPDPDGKRYRLEPGNSGP